MNTLRTLDEPQAVAGEWISFPGGELQARRPKALCAACRTELHQRAAAAPGSVAKALPRTGPGRAQATTGRLARTVCFQCYRAQLDRERSLRAAGDINTASEERFQFALPFEPLDRGRLERLRADRQSIRVADRVGAGQYIERGRQAQIAARHALQRITAGLDQARGKARAEHNRLVASAVHAAELQLPEAWLPFVVSR